MTRLPGVRVELRKQHYIQACAHAAIFIYWGWFWRPVYHAAGLIAAQLLFAYACDYLLALWRREPYVLGFGPFPIVFSTNLFLWFKPGYIAWQFVMIAVAFIAKRMLRWSRDGRRTHIFNPSAFALTVMSIGLLLTGKTDVTWGREIAITQFYPPGMYLFLFLVALPGQILFGVASMTVAAVTTTYLFSLAYFAATGTYFFLDSYVPISVFLGMHLLFTDPSTSPRSETGRMIFGAMYGLSVVGLYALLTAAGLPAFYDKLLQVPLMNLSVTYIDRIVPSARQYLSTRRNLVYVGVWATAFALMSTVGGMNDRHPGQFLPFWRNACREKRAGACRHAEEMEVALCRAGSGWSCNELGNRRAARDDEPIAALAAWQQGCALGFSVACENARDGTARTAAPDPSDYPILQRGSKALQASAYTSSQASPTAP